MKKVSKKKATKKVTKRVVVQRTTQAMDDFRNRSLVAANKAELTKQSITLKEAIKKVHEIQAAMNAPKIKKAVGAKDIKIKFDPKKHITLSDLARLLDMDYRSMFLKQKRLGILSFRASLNGADVICFDTENANKIKASTAPFITRAEVELVLVENQCKIDRPKMLRVLAGLAIVPEKRRRHEANPRSVLTVAVADVKRIKEGAKKLVVRKPIH